MGVCRVSGGGDGEDQVFGEVVRAHRRRLGITPEELAHKTGVSARGIRKIEANQTAAPRPVTPRLLAEAFALAGSDRDRFCESALAEVADQPPRRVTPALLPADVTGFIGRAGHLARLDAIAAAAADQPTAVVVCAVSGTAGVGKPNPGLWHISVDPAHDSVTPTVAHRSKAETVAA